MSTYNVHIKRWSEGNHEITFPVTKHNAYKDITGLLNWCSVREVGGGNGLGVYQGLVDAFFAKNGLPISDPNSNYREEGFSTVTDTRNTKWEYGTGHTGEVTAPHTYNMYCNREPRFYNAVTYNGAWLTYVGRKADMLYNHTDNVRSSSPHDAPQNGYLLRKAINLTDNVKTGKITDRQGFIYRLAFTYLDYAEAENEAFDDPAARSSALVYLNRIRERAGVRQYTFDNVSLQDDKYIHIDNSQAALRKVIRAERRVELCFEDNRWYDIRRWKDAENLPEMIGDGYGMNSLGGDEASFYKRTVFQHRIWKRQYYWMPVYIDEYEKNPNLVQGPFWESE